MVITFPGLLSSSWREVLLKGLVADGHIVGQHRQTEEDPF